MNRALVVGLGISALMLLVVMAKLTIWTYRTTAPPDPERARFMLECTYDWNLSPQACRQILNGDDPPVPAPEYDGC